MTTVHESKSGRMHLRVHPEVKRQLQRAADYRHQTISEFILEASRAAAESVIARQEMITLSEGEWQRVQKALLSPPEPNAALKRAVKYYRKVQRDAANQ